jgi:Amt family ammonium transporter
MAYELHDINIYIFKGDIMNKMYLILGSLLATQVVHGDELNSGDTAWILTSTALVLFMTLPGLALFYGGLVRTKNVLSVLMQCFHNCMFDVCMLGCLWL